MPRKTIFEGRKFRLTSGEVTLPDGSIANREIVEHPGAVVVLPLLTGGRALFEEHYRASVGEWLLELPAGTLEEGEDPADCARRELAEETGFEAGELVHLGSFYTSPGVMTERMHAYLATDLTAGAAKPEADEVMKIVEIPFEEALGMARIGKIEDAKTIVTLFLAEARCGAAGGGAG